MSPQKRLDIHFSIPLWQPQLPGDWRATLRGWLPSRGNVLFTLVVVTALAFAQRAGAFGLGQIQAAAPTTSTGTIAYQGRLADAAGSPLTGTYSMIFRLYSVASGGAPLWEEQWTGPNSVAASDGLFNVMLGSLTPIPQSVVTSNESLWLGITVGTDDEMTPRVQLGSVPFAFTVPDGAVTTTKIADGAVTQAKLGPDVSLVPPDGSITTEKLADGAVTQPKAPTLIKSPNNLTRVEFGTGTWIDVWHPNPAAGVYYRCADVTFTTPFTSQPVVLVTSYTPHPEDWAKVVNISINAFSACQLVVTSNLGTEAETFTWFAIGQ